MNVSKTSWHYRLLNQLDLISRWRQETLCKYFWKVVFACTFVPIGAIGVIWLGTIPLWWSLTDAPLSVAIIIGTFEIVGLLLVLRILVIERHTEEILDGTRPAPKVVPPTPPSLFAEWLRARHRQVCPFIDFVDKGN